MRGFLLQLFVSFANEIDFAWPRPVLDPSRFPIVDVTVLPIGREVFKIGRYLDLGSSTRVFIAHKVPADTPIPSSQTYLPPSDVLGRSISSDLLPDEIVIKCLSTNSTRLLESIENEFEIFTRLNSVRTVRKPEGFYLSPRWRCNPVDNLECQYIAMTFVNEDLERLISRNILRLKQPELKDRSQGIFSFEVFLLSLGLTLIDALDALHLAGFTHGDVRSCNVALQQPVYQDIVFLDVGAAHLLEDVLNEEEKRKLVEKDIQQVVRFITKPLEQKMESANYQGQYDELYTTLIGLRGEAQETMVQVLRDELLKFNIADTEGKVVYKYIP
jgi:hypothetical protein